MSKHPILSKFKSGLKQSQRPLELFDADIKEIFSRPGFLASLEESLKSKSGIGLVGRDSQAEKNRQKAAAQIKPPGFVPVLVEKKLLRKIQCTCKSSRCIKLYCECFRNQGFCGDCNCLGCLNKDDNQARKTTMAAIMLKNPSAFVPKIKPNNLPLNFLESGQQDPNRPSDLFIEVSRGCNCKNSNCQKKYCECFQYGLECSAKCSCSNCLNGNTGQENGEKRPGNRVFGSEEERMRRVLIEKLSLIKIRRFSSNQSENLLIANFN